MRPLADLVHCRAGDKGGDSLLVVVPYDPSHLDRLTTVITTDALAAHFGMAAEDVSIRSALGALVLTLRGRLGGGVTRSVGVDPHGKTFSGHLLAMEVPWT